MKLWRGQPDNCAWKPSPRDIARVWLGLAVAFYALGLTAFLSASRWSFTGLLGSLRRLFFDAFGPNGDIILYARIGTDTLEQAQRLLAAVKQTGRFPGANLRRMQAVLGYP